ncbi:hypothetical protein CC78DRAFT_620203 [Lojkania enalia]|uniref:Uncharacterized protein n=1 Tax=Lojkania enalia TaxID=147567 RepID=A0A9P4MZP3_9PLEO|nr:hypothetical protein CC78DRAFT_620203 [Didymosphaeria enalia]
MFSLKNGRFTLLKYMIFLTSLILLGLSISIIVVEDKAVGVHRNLGIQLPNSSIVEWLWVPLNPMNLDHGPSMAIFIAGAMGLLASVMGLGWIVWDWCGVRGYKVKTWGLFTCLIELINTGTGLAITAYVYVVESKRPEIPALLSFWKYEEFTREYYICDVFPFGVNDGIKTADEIYSFPACQHYQAARYELIPIASLAVVLAGLCILHCWESGAFRLLKRAWHPVAEDVEKRPVGVH